MIETVLDDDDNDFLSQPVGGPSIDTAAAKRKSAMIITDEDDLTTQDGDLTLSLRDDPMSCEGSLSLGTIYSHIKLQHQVFLRHVLENDALFKRRKCLRMHREESVSVFM